MKPLTRDASAEAAASSLHPFRQHPSPPPGTRWLSDRVLHITHGAARGVYMDFPWHAWDATGRLRAAYVAQSVEETLYNNALSRRVRTDMAAILEALLDGA